MRTAAETEVRRPSAVRALTGGGPLVAAAGLTLYALRRATRAEGAALA